MSQRYAVGIDVGTYQIKVVVVEADRDIKEGLPRIIGTGIAESRGLRYGYIINGSDVTASVRKAVQAAEKSSGVTIHSAFIGIGGVSLDAVTSHGSALVTRVDGEVTTDDIENVLEASEKVIPKAEITNKKVLHSIPLGYRLDDMPIMGRPEGMKGRKLEVKTLFITCLEQHLHDLIQAVEDAGIEVKDVHASPLAASVVNLTKAQKIAGCVLANIGSETLSLVVYENNMPISLVVFPIGSTDITNDIALGLKIPLEDAEKLKLSGPQNKEVSKRKLDDIVSSRLKDIFEMISSHLKKISKHEILPAGIIITGGGSGISTIDDLAKAVLKLPSKVVEINVRQAGSQRPLVKDASWSVAYGLGVIGTTHIDFSPYGSSGSTSLKQLWHTVVEWVKSLIP